MPQIPQTSGGEVEHEVYMQEGIILLVVKRNFAIEYEMENVAQVLLELTCEYLIS
jgi:hypothetical protein